MKKVPLFYVLEVPGKMSYLKWIEDNGTVTLTPSLDVANHFPTWNDAAALLPPGDDYVIKPVFYEDYHPIAEIETLLGSPTTTPVYFIYSHLTDHIKIGQSINPGERIKSLQTANAGRLTLLAVTTAYTEREMHKKFKDDRASGEWFRPSGELCGFIIGLR